ncbi:MAG: hypothetical protein ACRC6I_18120 [Paracoccaceae bacterium]
MSNIRVLGFRTVYSTRNSVAVEHDWVTYAPVHAIQSVQNEERVDRLMPKDSYANDPENLKLAAMDSKWLDIEPAYRAWKEGREIPTDGTPLALWAGITSAQAEIFYAQKIRTVEEVATMPDAVITKLMMPNARQYRDQAKLFLENKGASDFAGELSAMKQQNADLSAKLEEAIAMLNEMTAPPSDKPKRGRPRKDDGVDDLGDDDSAEAA